MATAIGEIIRNGVLFDMKNWEDESFNPDSLPVVVDRLFMLLIERHIDYLLVGGVALLSYVEGRNTQDVGFILARTDLEAMPEIVLTEENHDFARGSFEGLQIDLLLTSNAVFSLVISRYAIERSFGGQTIRTSNVEGLVLLKLYALPSLYRQGRFDRVSIYESDITLLLLNYSVNLNELLDLLTPHVIPTDLQEIRQIATDIQTRIQRFQTSRNRFEKVEEKNIE